MATKVVRGGKRVAPPKRNREPTRWEFPYDPFPKQATAHAVWADEVLFGGAAGPGKTDWLIGEVVTTLLELGDRLPRSAPRPAGVIFRRTYPELSRPGGIIQRLLERIPRSVGRYNAGDHTWTFRNGALLLLSHLQYEQDVQNHQGAEYAIVGFDQLEQFTLYQYRFMGARLRASGELAEHMAAIGFRPCRRATANPGGVGHGWVKARFIDPAPPGVVWRPEPTEEELSPGTRCFIPGKHTDNPALDEGYRDRLKALPPDERRALEEGDWDVFVGQRFKQFRREVHVIAPERLRVPLGGVAKAQAIDYGMAAPFVCLWGARIGEQLVVYREVDGVGLTPTAQAELILSSELPGERGEGRPMPAAVDPSTWARNPAEPKPPKERSEHMPPRGSIARAYADAGLLVRKANNDRLAGVALVDALLTGYHVEHDPRLGFGSWCSPWCYPGIVIYETCRGLIRTLPSLVRDKTRVEDIDTDGEDHWYDALRYLAMLLFRGGVPVGRGPGEPPPTPRGGRSREGENLSTGRTTFGGLFKRGL